MNNIRKNEKIKINDRKRELLISIKYIEDEIESLRQQKESDYTKFQLQKQINFKEEREQEYNSLEERLNQLDLGLLDNELKFSIKLVSDESKKKSEEIANRKLINENRKKEDKQISKNYYMNQRNEEKKIKATKREMGKAYKHWVKADSQLPEYMNKKLKNMPNNKGYIWKSIYYFGHRKREPMDKPVVVFEKQKGNISATIEWTPEYYKIYHKTTEKGKRKLVYSESRKQRK